MEVIYPNTLAICGVCLIKFNIRQILFSSTYRPINHFWTLHKNKSFFYNHLNKTTILYKFRQKTTTIFNEIEKRFLFFPKLNYS